MSERRTTRGQPRAAVISLHTSPEDQPGVGDSGGMNVYVMEVAKKLAAQGIAVDVYTRCHGENRPQVQEVAEGGRLIQVQAGPCAPVPKEDLPRLLRGFLDGVLEFAASDDARPHRHAPYDVIHSHYWLSGWVGARTKRIWDAPLVTSFHTLGKVKNVAAGSSAGPEPAVRLAGEQGVVRHSDRILAPTPAEVAHLVGLYDADPRRIRIVPPGVDRSVFAPRPRREAKERLHLAGRRVLLFVGRLQPLKGPEIAIRALAALARRAPAATRDVVLVVVGGPSGSRPDDEVGRLSRLAAGLAVADRVVFLPPRRHDTLADFYSAAEAVLIPSRSESFGLVALEAQACGTPVVAAAVGGLRYAVLDGQGGFLVRGHNPSDYADRVLWLLTDRDLAARMSARAVAHAARFSWEATAAEIGEVYRELVHGREMVA